MPSDGDDLLARMIDSEQAQEIDVRLAGLLDMPLHVVRDYLAGHSRAGSARRTGIREVRGTHGIHYVRDPEGVDIPPYAVPA